MNVKFQIRQNQNRSSELRHYGVKGMKWGVRKEPETSGRKSSNGTISGGPDKNPKIVSKKEFEKGAGLSSKPQSYSKTSQSISIYMNFLKKTTEDKAFAQWLTKDEDRYNRYKESSTIVSTWIKNMADVETFNSEKDNAADAAEDLYNLIVEFEQDPSAWSTDEDKENSEERARLREELQNKLKEANISVTNKQHVSITWEEGWSNTGKCVFLYEDGFGDTWRFQPNQLDQLVQQIGEDAKKLKDVRNSITREKNVDSLVSLAKVTKRERTDSGKANEKNEQVGAKTTYLATKSAKNKAVKDARIQSSLKQISSASANLNKKLSSMKSNGKEAMKSTSVKKTLTQKISDVAKSANSSIKNAANYVKNLFTINNNVKTSRLYENWSKR